MALDFEFRHFHPSQLILGTQPRLQLVRLLQPVPPLLRHQRPRRQLTRFVPDRMKILMNSVSFATADPRECFWDPHLAIMENASLFGLPAFALGQGS